LQQASEFGGDGREFGLTGAGPSDQDEIPVRRPTEPRAVQKGLDPPAQTVADDRVADVLRNRDPHPRRTVRRGGQENEKGPNLPLPAALDP
jgi:hypothetical protein